MHPHHPVNIDTLLSHILLFEGLAAPELARIAHGTREVRASKGDILFHKGDPCTGFHLLVYGQMKLAFTSQQGNEKVVEIVQQGQSFGEAIMFMEKPYIVFAQALTDSLLLHVSKPAVFAELERDPRLGRKMLAGMAIRLHTLMNDVESYSLHSGKERIIGYLLRELAERRPERHRGRRHPAHQQGRHRLAPQPHPGTLLAHPARTDRTRTDRRRGQEDPYSERGESAEARGLSFVSLRKEKNRSRSWGYGGGL